MFGVVLPQTNVWLIATEQERWHDQQKTPEQLTDDELWSAQRELLGMRPSGGCTYMEDWAEIIGLGFRCDAEYRRRQVIASELEP